MRSLFVYLYIYMQRTCTRRCAAVHTTQGSTKARSQSAESPAPEDDLSLGRSRDAFGFMPVDQLLALLIMDLGIPLYLTALVYWVVLGGLVDNGSVNFNCF